MPLAGTLSSATLTIELASTGSETATCFDW
jgi:hypothetical protein